MESTGHLLLYNGLPVCVVHERVNRYKVIFLNMLTTPYFYGMMNAGGKVYLPSGFSQTE